MKRGVSFGAGRAVAAIALVAALLVVAPRSAFAAPDHSAWSALLARHVHAGAVDYAGLTRERAVLDRYLRQLGAVDEAALAQLSRDERLAYWINAYNALVVQTVIDRYPIRGRTLRGITKPANSIWQIPGAFDGRRFVVGRRRLSLDDIEHAIVRPAFREPRVHFALVCAARGCPALRAEAYVPERLAAQLDEQVRLYLADARHGLSFDAVRATARVSRIFEWFAEDFATAPRDGIAAAVPEFIARYVDPSLATQLRDGRVRIEYLEYDWTLNAYEPP